MVVGVDMVDVAWLTLADGMPSGVPLDIDAVLRNEPAYEFVRHCEIPVYFSEMIVMQFGIVVVESPEAARSVPWVNRGFEKAGW